MDKEIKAAWIVGTCGIVAAIIYGWFLIRSSPKPPEVAMNQPMQPTVIPVPAFQPSATKISEITVDAPTPVIMDTETLTPVPTPIPIATSTPTSTPTTTDTPTPIPPTDTPTNTPTATPSFTPTPTDTPTPTPLPTIPPDLLAVGEENVYGKLSITLKDACFACKFQKCLLCDEILAALIVKVEFKNVSNESYLLIFDGRDFSVIDNFGLAFPYSGVQATIDRFQVNLPSGDSFSIGVVFGEKMDLPKDFSYVILKLKDLYGIGDVYWKVNR